MKVFSVRGEGIGIGPYIKIGFSTTKSGIKNIMGKGVNLLSRVLILNIFRRISLIFSKNG